ncbi:MAG: hypothetical protein A2Z37_15360 [Chloroflexi bacterium RBG_19FT_COMBO_62_14]|nr:MAG: hypothetical protein A2Z37_15360 [Chloroflexi bacterium RBG_19FT_COMBO_62_14]
MKPGKWKISVSRHMVNSNRRGFGSASDLRDLNLLSRYTGQRLNMERMVSRFRQAVYLASLA